MEMTPPQNSAETFLGLSDWQEENVCHFFVSDAAASTVMSVNR